MSYGAEPLNREGDRANLWPCAESYESGCLTTTLDLCLIWENLGEIELVPLERNIPNAGFEMRRGDEKPDLSTVKKIKLVGTFDENTLDTTICDHSSTKNT